MGTFATVRVPGHAPEDLGLCADTTCDTFARLEQTLSIYAPESDIARLNRAAGNAPVPVPAAAREVLSLAVQYAERSQGAFDPTVTPLLRLWGFSGGTTPEQPPDPAAIHRTLQLVGYRHLVLTNGTAGLTRAGMAVDLGGIAKGYAVDVAFRAVKAQIGAGFLIDLGGNIRCRGQAQPGRPWTIGVRNPFDREQLLGTIRLPDDFAVATSGNYERFVTIGGRRYAHILDPRTGLPVEGMAGVSVLAPTAAEADALSTALFVLGPDRSRSILAGRPACEALFVPDQTPVELWITPGLRDHFTAAPEHAGSVCVLSP